MKLRSLLLLAVLSFSAATEAGEAEHLRAQAEQGSRQAQFRLGELYFEGKEVAIDYAQALYWWRKAAEQNDPRAQNGVGTLYDHGKGVKKDYREAARWFRLAANQGHLMARRNLGWMHEKGQGFPVDRIKAYKWQMLAQMSRHPLAQPTLPLPCPLCDKLAKKMRPDEIAQARELALRWQPEDLEE
ncbi:MAG: sel1 repeat family protein [Magnetococcales bacterium]|nr:sel1 repeat family protein [Magnetococcales bacterium]MBF0116313.1 sel1 repeat family protein [Magnetococcales bacterium]